MNLIHQLLLSAAMTLEMEDDFWPQWCQNNITVDQNNQRQQQIIYFGKRHRFIIQALGSRSSGFDNLIYRLTLAHPSWLYRIAAYYMQTYFQVLLLMKTNI